MGDAGARYYMIELGHVDVSHFVIEQCRRVVNGCTVMCGCIGLILFRYVSGRNNMRYQKYIIVFGIRHF